jgi:hypothetical protein
MLMGVVEAEQAERDQDADCARIDAAIALAEKDIAAVEDRQLAPDEIRKQWFAIRDRTVLAIRDVRNNIVRRANETEATQRWMLEKFVSDKSDERILREFSNTLKDVPTKDLVDYLRYLIQVGDRARIQTICKVFAARDDRSAYNVSFDKMLTQFAGAEYGHVWERLTRICRLAEKVDARLANLFCAYSITNRSRAISLPRSTCGSNEPSTPAVRSEEPNTRTGIGIVRGAKPASIPV